MLSSVRVFSLIGVPLKDAYQRFKDTVIQDYEMLVASGTMCPLQAYLDVAARHPEPYLFL